MYFSNEEKSILKKLIDSNTLRDEGIILLDVFLEDEFFGDSHNVNIGVDKSNNKIFLSIRPTDVLESRRITVNTIVLINLLMNLESSRLIAFIDNGSKIGKTSGTQYSNTIELPISLSNFLCEKIGDFILPSETLRELVNNNFKSAEEIRHNETMYWTRFAIFIAMVIGVIGIFT